MWNLARTSAPQVVAAAAITSGSATVTVPDAAALEGALWVSGAGIWRRALVRSIDSATQVTLDRNATATNPAASLTFLLEPVTLEEAREQLRMADTMRADDLEIARKITAARRLAEAELSRSFISSTYRLGLDSWDGTYANTYRNLYLDRSFASPSLLERTLASPGGTVKIPVADLLGVGAVTYFDPNGVLKTLDPAAYQVTLGAPGSIVPAYGFSWPSVRVRPESVTVDFTAGYGPDARSVPEHVKEGLLLLVAHLYENREATVTSSIGLRIAPYAEQLLAIEDWGFRG